MVVVETTRGVTTRVVFLALILTSLGSKSGTPLYLNHRNGVNNIMKLLTTNMLLLKLCRNGLARRETTRETVARAASGCRFPTTTDLTSIVESPEIFGRATSITLAEAWDAAWPLAPTWVLAMVAA